MAITWADIVALAAELSVLPVAAQPVVVAHVNESIVDLAWPTDTLTDHARKLLAAHMATVLIQGGLGPAGQVVGESVGGISRQYAAFSPMGSDPSFAGTPYGKLYRALLRTNARRIGLVC